VLWKVHSECKRLAESTWSLQKQKTNKKPSQNLAALELATSCQRNFEICSCYPTTRDVPSLPLKIHSLMLQANTPPLLPPSYPLGIATQQTSQGLGTALNPSSLLPSTTARCTGSGNCQPISECLSITPWSESPWVRERKLMACRHIVCGTTSARYPLRSVQSLGRAEFLGPPWDTAGWPGWGRVIVQRDFPGLTLVVHLEMSPGWHCRGYAPVQAPL